MSLDSIGLTIQAITPPDGLPHTDRKTEILELPNYLQVNADSAGEDLMVLVVSSAIPQPEDHDKIWVKTDAIDVSEGTTHYTQRGCYKYDAATAIWELMAGIGIYVGDTAPTDTEVLWLNDTDGASARGLYAYISSAWTLISSPGLYVGTTEPTDTTVPWLNTTDNVTYCKGLYVYEGAAWVLKTTPVITQDAAPTGSPGALWLKSTDEGGLWRWDAGTLSWKNATMPLMASGEQARPVVPGGTPPSADERDNTLWAKTDTAPRGLFFWNGANWESVAPITVQQVYPEPPAIPANVGTGYLEINGLPYPQSVVFRYEPVMSITFEYDDLNAGGHAWASWGVSWGAIPSLSSYNFAVYNSEAARNMRVRLSVTGIILI